MPFGIGSLAPDSGAPLTPLEAFRRDLLKPHFQSRGDDWAGSEPRLVNELSSLQTHERISLETLRNANAQFGFLNRFFNTSG
jgi:hypothetical protein